MIGVDGPRAVRGFCLGHRVPDHPGRRSRHGVTVPARIVQTERDQAMHSLLAHVGKIHRRAGRVLGFYDLVVRNLHVPGHVFAALLFRFELLFLGLKVFE
jgi:hypothetical protein